ncbi:MAG: peptidoglycan DD-metalloendopeptidase family protein [Solirubrobacterales bacterium]
MTVALLAAVVFSWEAGTAASAEPQQPLNFKLGRGTVSPKQAVPDSVRPQRIIFRFRASRATPIEIRVIKLGSGRVVRRFATSPLQPGRWHRVNFDGLDRKGRLAGAGRYRVRVGPLGGRLLKLSRLKLHSHTFPVLGGHGTRGGVGEFGADRVDGRTHEGFDITANCGSPLVTVRSGTILKAANDPELKGNYVVLKGRSERRTYLYAHLRRPASVKRGQTVKAGRRIGSVGQTGNAAGTPCHLHFEVRSGGRLLNPEPLINSWVF